jgi:pSer/pThr/pTyr-binding forkhead associated (FHA) protein
MRHVIVTRPADPGRYPAVSGIIDEVASIDIQALARAAYDAYRKAQKGSVPQWEDIPETEQQAWRAAVTVVSSPGDATLTEAGPTPSLVVQVEGQTQVFSTDFTAGRQGNLAVRDDHASNHHARFQFAHGVWYVEDLSSTNGTFLNGRRMFAAQALRKGDKIRIGRTTIRVVSA